MSSAAARILLLATSAGAALVQPPPAQKTQKSPRSWDVTLLQNGERHVLSVPEDQPLLTAVESAGLGRNSECRRGNCLSCAARVVQASPFSLRVAGDTALCDEAAALGMVLLCSSYVVGEGVELALGCEAEAWEVQHALRWEKAWPAPERELPPAAFSLPEDAVILLERCLDGTDGGDEAEGEERNAASGG